VSISNRISLLQRTSAALLAIAVTAPAVAAPRSQLIPAPRRAFRSVEQTAPRALQFQVLRLERSRQNHLLVRASINGKPALLGVDTGAPVSAIAVNRVAYFGMTPAKANSEIPTRLQINGTFNGVAMARSLQLGALNLVDEPMVAIDLGSTSRAAKAMNEQAIDGIIGADILFPTNAILDCRAQVLILKIDPNVRGNAPGLDYHGFIRVPMHVSSGFNLYVDGRFNGTRAKLMVDTGAFGTLMHQGFVRQMKIPLRETPFSSAGVNLKQRGVQLATISRFSVGAVNMRSKEVGVIDLEGLVRTGLLDATPPVAGLLGSEILRRHSAIIDFGTRTLYLKPVAL
jgi:predicted aspartyl protease